MRIRPLVVIGSIIAAVAIHGTATAATNFNVTNSGATAYVVDGVNNSTLSLTRGQIYTFTVTASGHPFWITTARGAAGAVTNQFSNGVTNNGIALGTVTFAVPSAAPPTLFYQCGIHDAMGGTINIVSPSVPAFGAAAMVALVGLMLVVGLLALRRKARV